MRISVVLFMWINFAFLTSQASLVNAPLEDQASQFETEIKALNLPQPTAEQIEFLRSRFQYYLQARESRMSHAHSYTIEFIGIDRYFNELMTNTLDRLIRQNKIVFITPALSKKLRLHEYLCNSQFSCQKNSTQPNCRSLKGFYIHLIDTVFINPDLDWEAIARAVFHETIHAYQFTYRFPLDAQILSRAVDSGKIEESKALDFLSFSYEAQANWYELSATENVNWNRAAAASKADVPKRIGTAFIQFLRLPIHALTNSAATEEGYYSAPGQNELTQNLPFVDRPRKDYGFFYSEGNKTGFLFREPIVLSDTSTLFSGNVDLELHKKFSKALECTYFGKLPFLFQSHEDDQKLFKDLSDNYYKNILIQPNLGEDLTSDRKDPLTNGFSPAYFSACDKLMNKIQNASSPFLTWLKIEGSELKDCPAFEKGFDPNSQAWIKKQYDKKLGAGTFNLPKSGTEGGGIGLDFSPSVGFFPELEVLPLGAE